MLAEALKIHPATTKGKSAFEPQAARVRTAAEESAEIKTNSLREIVVLPSTAGQGMYRKVYAEAGSSFLMRP
jgi:hypothetical protein